MLVLKVIRITEDLVSGALALPLSVTDYLTIITLDKTILKNTTPFVREFYN